MKTVRMLDWPLKRYYGETHVFHRWAQQLADHGYKVELYYDHHHPKLLNAECLIIHSRYFSAWQHLPTRSLRNQEELLYFLQRCKKGVDQLVWLDAADSTGSSDFMLLPYVDVFLKKQLLCNKSHYLGKGGATGLRIWLPGDENTVNPGFKHIAESELHKLRLGWNIGMNDYRYFGYKMSRLSNYLSYRFYPLKFTKNLKSRPLDVAFRGTVHQDSQGKESISEQRNQVLKLLKNLQRNIPKGPMLSRRAYLEELSTSKIGISPFGWGEICYRDFEIFIAGSLLLKPDMGHLETFPDLFIKNRTYIPLRWDLANLEEQLDTLLNDYTHFQEVAIAGQELYRKALNDHEKFIQHFIKVIS